jgi:hypothetical protein
MQQSDIAVPEGIPFYSSVVMPSSFVVNAKKVVAVFSHSDLEFLLQLDPFDLILRPRPLQFLVGFVGIAHLTSHAIISFIH